MPASAEAEKHVLACCLIEEDAGKTITRAVSKGVRPESFYFPANRIIWEAILELYANKPPVTLQTLSEELATRQQLEQAGGFPYLIEVTQGIPTTVHAAYFIDALLEKQALRDFIKSASGLIENCYNYTGGGVTAQVAPALAQLEGIRSGFASHDEKTLQDAASETAKQVEAMINGETVVDENISWGFSDFDRIFHPMMPGELIIIAARPSMGKTTLSDQVALVNAMQLHRDTAIFSLEVTVEQKPRKFAQIISGHSWRRLPRAHKQDKEEFLRALHEIRICKQLHCYYREQNIDGICARIRVLHQQGKLRLAIVDYLQLVEMGVEGNRNDSVGYGTRKLKLLALELGIPIIVLSQLNRANEREGREPRLSDLRDSGNIEQDADRVLFIDRPAVDRFTNQPQNLNDDSVDSFYTEVIQAKGRDVGTSRVGMYFKRSRTTFIQIKIT